MEFKLAASGARHQFPRDHTVSSPRPPHEPMRPRPRRHSHSPIHRSVRLGLIITAAFAVAPLGCANPRAEAAIAQELNDAATEIGAVKGDVAQLQSDVDSLKHVIAKQDTVISRLVEVTHVPR
jgi:septal ring factor EnvC (AmiA/AmiB activator)